MWLSLAVTVTALSRHLPGLRPFTGTVSAIAGQPECHRVQLALITVRSR
jgi:hypothetical protein